MSNYKTPEGFDLHKDPAACGKLTETEYFSKTTGTTRKCFVYTPPAYNPEETYPVMYLLHGIGGTHTEWLNGAPNEILSNLINAGEAVPMIVVIPNVRAMTNDSVPEEIFTPTHAAAFDNFINDLQDDLMPFISANYKVHNTREFVAVAGLSMGGRESIYIGLSMPETFGYIGAFSPAPGVLPYESREPMIHKGLFTPQQMTLPEEFKQNTFILMNNGLEEERFHDIATSYHNAFNENGVPHIYYTTDGGHDFRVWKNGLYHFAKRIFIV